MMGPRVSPIGDQPTRQMAQDEFSRPVIVEAGAGTGKTALLVARVAAWCVGSGWQRHHDVEEDPETVARRVIEGIVAITFTEAAAAEMAARIGAALTGLGCGENPIGWSPGGGLDGVDDREITRRAAILGSEVHRLSVTTIHSFCQRVLAAHPFEAGLHPNFEIDADGSQLETLVDEVVEEALRELEQSPLRRAWERLAVTGHGPVDVAEALRLLVAAGAKHSDLQRDPFDEAAAAAVAAELVSNLKAFFNAEDSHLVKVPRNGAAEHARASLVELAHGLSRLGRAADFRDVQKVTECVDHTTVKRLSAWSKSTFTQGEEGALGEAVKEVSLISGRLVEILAPLAKLDIEAFGAGREILSALLVEVENRRAIRGLATFADLLEKTSRLFEDHDEICRSERRRMDQLLVDEFQDTDDVQCRIVARLALEGPEDERPGLFIVGDPKQSIYAWRSADLAAYDEFVDLLLARDGLKGSLTHNFRSVQPILDEVERVVAPVMHREPGFQPSFEALEATGKRIDSMGFDHLPWTAVEHWVCWPMDEDGVPSRDRKRQAPTTKLEARAIAADIRQLHDEAGVSFGDVAVLLRATTAQGEILEAFRELGIPFEVAREREYFKQREIIEAAALVRTLIEPADTLALLTVLRSDAVGVPDVALAPLWDGGLPAAASKLNGFDDAALVEVRRVVRLAAATAEEAPGSGVLPRWSDAVLGSLENIAELRRSMREDSPQDFVERLRTLWLAEVSAGARHLGRFRQARLESFYADLEKTLCRGSGGGAELARLLRRAVKEGGEAPTPSEPDREADAVHVMTIYGAKGLDFEHVYLAQIHKRTGSFGSPPAAILRRFKGLGELSLFGWATPSFQRAEERRELQARAERVRLLYVAMTRAKQRLVISGGWSDPGEFVDPLGASTLAELVAHRGDPMVIGDLIGRGIDREAGMDPGVGWVIPALADLPGPGSGGHRGGSATVVGDRVVAADADAITGARSEAEQRMAARWTAPASDAAHRSKARMETDPGEDGLIAAMPVGRSAAAAVGTAVHHLFETLDLAGDLGSQIGDRRQAVIEEAVSDLDGAQACEAVGRLEALLDRLPTSEVLKRLSELVPTIVARELSVFLRPLDDDGTSVISGAVDLVYADPDDGRLVIADYKTDAVNTDAEIAERVERYRPQLKIYAAALEKALSLDKPPFMELWFLHADRIVRLS